MHSSSGPREQLEPTSRCGRGTSTRPCASLGSPGAAAVLDQHLCWLIDAVPHDLGSEQFPAANTSGRNSVRKPTHAGAAPVTSAVRYYNCDLTPVNFLMLTRT